MNRRSWYVAAASLWTLAIFIGTWLPGKHLPHPELEDSTFFSMIPLDKVAHAGLFAGFAFLWLLARSTPAIPFKKVFLVGVLVAILTELGQATDWVGRDADISDVVADTFGLFLGAGFFVWMIARFPATRSSLDNLA